MAKQLASILVGDHLGQLKKVLIPSGEVTTIADCVEPSSSNPVVSIEPLGRKNKHLVANKNGQIYIYNSIDGTTKQCDTYGSESLIKVLPYDNAQDNFALIYEKQIVFEGRMSDTIKQKKGSIKNAKLHGDKLAIVGKDIPLRIFDVNTRNKIYEADLPDKDWLGIQPECFVSGLDIVGQTRIATCSKSDPVIRVYDTRQSRSSSGYKPIIKVDLDQTAFNEHGDANRYVSIASTGIEDHRIVVGSNVGQILAIDLRFNVKQVPKKKKMQPRTSKVLGSFKGSRGATIKDVKVANCLIENAGEDESTSCHKVISCCLDRYLRIHNFTKTSRQLDKHVYMKTKPLCCSPIFFEDPE